MDRRNSPPFCAAFCVAVMFFTMLQVSAVAQPTLHVIREVKHDVSPPLADLARLTPAQPNQFSPRVLKVLPTGPATEMPQYAAPDAALQQKVLAPVAATLGLNFEGLGLGQYGFLMQYAPPDTNGTVGATQYVQWVNAEFAVFSKTSGALVAGPTPGNALWAGFGGGCQSNNDGDPIVQYDKIANRWIFTQFSVSTTPYLQCVAVSTTSDATGTYNRYAFQFANFPDYPKLGVWPDAYYISFNMYAGGFVGADACAMDRSKMLAGQAATIVCFQQGSLIGSLLPSDMDGTIQPAAGEPAFFMNFGSNSLRLWKFHVNFTNPASSTFTGPTTLSVAAFTPQCFSACVVQPGTTQKLDALGDRLMYRLAYRKFTDGHEALVVNHSITTGERWYEVRNPNGTPAVFQQGTFSPDSNTRWMGSVAMDHVGDMALGYSVSSGSVFPSIYFTGRIPGDPAGTMETEQLIVNGTGSQTSGLSRWGDYSAMAVDPVDDCTFWYTQEYIKSNGSFNWNTRIANFKFSNTGNFSLSATPSSQRIHPGDGANYTVTSTPGCGFTGTVSLTVAGLPTGASASFNPASIPNGAGSSTLNVSTSSNTPFGTYTLTITGTSGNLVQSVPVTLVVSNSWSWTLQTYTTCGTASFFGGGNLNSLQWHFLVEPSDPAGGQYTWTLFDSVGTFATGSYCGYEYCSPPTGNDGSNITASRLPVGTPSFRVYGQFKTSAGCSTSYSGQVQMQP